MAKTLDTDVDVPRRVVYIIGEIDFEVAGRFVKSFRHLDQTAGPITIALMSMGGQEPAGWAIFDAIRRSRNIVTIEATGACASMAVAVLQAGDVRRITPEARIGLHVGTIAVGGSDQRTVMAMGVELVRTNTRYHQVLAKRTGLTVQEIKDLCEREVGFDADEALDWGFVDCVTSPTRPLLPSHGERQSIPKSTTRRHQ